MSEQLYSIKEQTLTALGNAIRTKTGKTTRVEEYPLGCDNPATFHFDTEQIDISTLPAKDGTVYYTQDIIIPGATTYEVVYFCDESKGDGGSNWQANKYVDEYGTKSMGMAIGSDEGKLSFEAPYGFEFQYNIKNTWWVLDMYQTLDLTVSGYDATGKLVTARYVTVPNTMTPLEMADAVNEMPDPIKTEPIVLTGSCDYTCGGAIAGTYIDLFGNTISTSNITSASSMFSKNTATIIPFEINYDASNYSFSNMFSNCSNLRALPKINIAGIPAIPTSAYRLINIDNMFEYCYRLREIPEDFFPFSAYPEEYWAARKTLKANGIQPFGSGLHSLRRVPTNTLRYCLNYGTSQYNSIYCGSLVQCYALDEVLNLPVEDTTYTSNAFMNFATSACRLKNMTFETNEDGSAKTANWKSQTINLSNMMGHMENNSYSKTWVLDYNSGITADKEVIDDATYQALKDDPDWFTTKVAYSRYNHDSAVATINSLPDTSAYLATAGGTNTIKFKGAAGEKTDGGAINTLTEEEIAVATAKGWTVTLV